MKKLTIRIPVDDDTFNFVIDMMKHASYDKRYYRSLVPPDNVEYVIWHLSDKGVDNLKAKFREIFETIQPEYRKYCTFTVEDMEKK